jgi:hypothetical protein
MNCASIPRRDIRFSSLQRFQTAFGNNPGPISASGAISLAAKLPGHESNHSHPSTAEVKNGWSYCSLLHLPSKDAQELLLYFAIFSSYVLFVGFIVKSLQIP